MSVGPTSQSLPVRPDLDQLKKQAKELRASGAAPSLAAAQLALARSYGFASWRALKTHVLQITLRRLIEENDVAAMRALLSTSPSLSNTAFADGSLPVHLAAGENRPEAIAALVEAGATFDARFGKSGHSALSWALTCWSYAAAERIVALGHEPDLFCAAGLGDLARVRRFWIDGRLKRRPSRTGSSRYDANRERLPSPPPDDADQVSDALYLACRCDRLEVARWLLDRGADPNWPAFAGATPLAWAEFAGNAALTGLLRERGGADDRRDAEFGATPRAFGVMVLAGWGFAKLLFERLTADRSIVTLTCDRGTPLHVAAAAGHTAIVKLLLVFGADKSARDAEGRTTADVAAQAGHTAVAELLR